MGKQSRQKKRTRAGRGTWQRGRGPHRNITVVMWTLHHRYAPCSPLAAPHRTVPDPVGTSIVWCGVVWAHMDSSREGFIRYPQLSRLISAAFRTPQGTVTGYDDGLPQQEVNLMTSLLAACSCVGVCFLLSAKSPTGIYKGSYVVLPRRRM